MDIWWWASATISPNFWKIYCRPVVESYVIVSTLGGVFDVKVIPRDSDRMTSFNLLWFNFNFWGFGFRYTKINFFETLDKKILKSFLNHPNTVIIVIVRCREIGRSDYSLLLTCDITTTWFYFVGEIEFSVIFGNSAKFKASFSQEKMPQNR